MPLPPPRVSLLSAAGLFAAFLIPVLGEEIGWCGYLIDRMQPRSTALRASLIVGVMWAVWHLVLLVQAHRSPTWIAYWCLGTVANRVLITWRYNNTNHSVFAAALCHAMDNVGWLTFPNAGSHYDPRVTGPITAGVAVVVTAMWGARTLRLPQHSRRRIRW